jgi:NAD-dependent deacetylase
VIVRQELDAAIEEAARILSRAGQIVAFTGAGVSTESGIPDFRGDSGLWRRLDPAIFSLERFTSSAAGRAEFWRTVSALSGPIQAARPNDAHIVLAKMFGMGLLEYVITQNIDGLHQRAGIPGQRVIELHGNDLQVVCLSCGKRFERSVAEEQLAAGSEDPSCPACGGILKPTVIFFGEMLDKDTLERAFLITQACDAMIVIGSSLQVAPASYVPQLAKRIGAALIIVNFDETPFDYLADVVLRGKAGQLMTRLFERFLALRRDLPDPD